MTEPLDESLEPKSDTNDLTASPLSEAPDSPVQVEDGLPEWEPLTPELVEDEAIRGDFVLRWAVVGLALLLGISQIAETRTLIHIKNGQYLTSHGFLPGSKDVLSQTASDRNWINLSWLFDIAVSVVHSIGGGIGLSMFQGVLAALAFGLLAHTVRPDIRTWWGSLCAVLALLVCYPQFTVQPELITLLGTSFVLWTLVKSNESGHARELWLLVPAMWLWAQLDQRAWFGWFLILLWAAGEWFSQENSVIGEKRPWGKVALASLGIVAIHPFLWESWLAPVRLYLTDYPAMQFAYKSPIGVDQAIYPIWAPFLWRAINHRTVAALVLVAATVVTMLLNRSRTRLPHVFAFVGFNALSLFATHELAVAALVNCALCTINAQAWYREQFGQVYSVDWRELLFSRGGRAITVFSFFALAWLILSGRLDGPGGKRTGLGFDIHLANAMSDYQSLNSNLVDDHPFNFSMRQGDLMIWGGLKPFVDSRAGLYYSRGPSNLLDVHDKTRKALQQKREKVVGTGEPEVWKATFEKYHLKQAWPRLNGPIPPPDYYSFYDLLTSSEFRLSNLVSATAVFVRVDPNDETTTAYLKEHPFDFIEKAFREKSGGAEELTRDWSKPATAYDNLFSLRRPIVPGGVQAAQHYLQLAASGDGFSASQRCACALLAIRSANEGLRSEPNSAEGYRALGLAYSLLGQFESGILKQGGVNIPNTLRYFQSVIALRQALALNPDDAAVIRQLVQQYEIMGRIDVQLDLIRKLKQLRPNSKSMTDEQRQERDSIIDAISRLEEPVERIDSMVEKHLSENADRYQVAAGTNQVGGLLKSIKILEEDAIYLEKNPPAKLALGKWLMEAGRGRDADSILEGLEGFAMDVSMIGWRDAAATSSLATANYLRSIKLWGDQLRSSSSSQVPQLMNTLPFLTLGSMWMGPDAYPTANIAAAAQVIQGTRTEAATLYYQIAMAQIEAGFVEEAGNSIRQAIQQNPVSVYRPILRFYLECLTGEQIDLKGPSPEVEELTDLVEVDQSQPDPKPEK